MILIGGFFGRSTTRKRLPPITTPSFFSAGLSTARNDHKLARIVCKESSHRTIRYADEVGGGAPVPERVTVLKNITRETAVARWAVRQKPGSAGDVFTVRRGLQPRVHVSAERSHELLCDAVFEPSCQIVSVLFGGNVLVKIVLEKDVVLHTIQAHDTKRWVHAREDRLLAFEMVLKSRYNIARLPDKVGASFATEHVHPSHRYEWYPSSFLKCLYFIRCSCESFGLPDSQTRTRRPVRSVVARTPISTSGSRTPTSYWRTNTFACLPA